MIDKEYSMKLIVKLITLTSQGKIIWTTLPYYFESNDNEPLRKMVIANNKYVYTPLEAKKMFLINEYKSFCTTINNGAVIIFTRAKEKEIKLDISIQTHKTHSLISLYNDIDINEKIKELVLQISTITDDGLKFINDILNI